MSTSTSTPSSSSSSSSICTEQHAYYCMDVLQAHFEGREPITAPFDNASDKFALFVTWNIASPSRPKAKPDLRGCIGNFAPMPLAKGLKDYALVSVSLLTPFTPIPTPLDWTIGEHGIHLTFPSPSNSSRTLSATYLPEIAAEQGWSKEETILSAIKKAGHRGRVEVGDKLWQSLDVKVYGSVKAGATWSEYLEWKESLDAGQ